ncbi:MAG TPA: SMC family ATPase [Deltaproteobacteria bacterium]|nr:SMC family ATPase [Deltaproteobacteria bacterium]
MRPTLLELEGFTCYRQRVVVPFGEVKGPLAIAGPTGSGKSSLLDAILFALYGQVPRVGRQVASLVTKGERRAAVRFEFDHGEARYRVVRTTYSNTRPATAQLERIDEDEVRIADGVREVNARLQHLLGLTHEAFMQAVILPQGRFASFLQARPSDRRSLLTELLGLEILNDMGSLANEEARTARDRSSFIEEQLAGDFTDATVEAVEALEAELASLGRTIASLERGQQAAEQQLVVLRRRREATRRWRGARRRREALQLDAPRIEAARIALEAHARARQLEGPRDTAVRTAAAHSRAVSALEAATTRLAQRRAAQATAQAAHDAAEARALEIPGWRGRLAQLVRLEEQRRARQRQEKLLADLETRLSRGRSAAGELEATLAEVVAEGQRHAEALALALEQLAALGYDRDVHEQIKGQQQAGFELQRLEAALAESGVSLERLTAERGRLAALVVEAQGSVERTEATLAQARRRFAQARAAHRDAEGAHKAAALRDQLHVGHPCPVCDQAVVELPSASAPPELARSQQAMERAEREGQAARARWDEAVEAHKTAVQRLERLDAQLIEQQQQQQRTRAERDAAAEALRQAIDPWIPGAAPPLQRLAEATERLARAAEAHDALQARRQATERRHALAETRRGELSARYQEQRTRTTELQHEVDAARAQLEAMRPPDGVELGTEGLEVERRRLEASIEAAEATARATGAALAEARQALAVAQDRHQRAEADADAAAAEATAAAEAAEAAAIAAGFASLKAAAGAILSESAAAELQHTIETHVRERQQAEATEAEVAPIVADAPVSAVDVTRAEASLSANAAALKQQAEARARLAERCRGMRQRVGRARELREELLKARARGELYTALANELRGNRFPAWLLETEFRDLVKHASKRLFRFSGRYTLLYEDPDFLVVDHDNAMETRSTATLSGGETFLCSLALALELSEQIQRRAGSMHLDCLFIDEGFGTLDPETLDTVAEAIEDLAQGNRLVGLISHVATLTERMPSRLEVLKGQGGSTLSLDLAT